MDGSLTLHGDGVPAALLDEVARREGCRIVGPADAAGAEQLVVLLGDLDEDRLVRALRPPAMACVEAGAALKPLLAELSRHGLMLSLTTATAYRLEAAQAFCDALAARTKADKKLRQAMELALHEAMVNAMVHGNLEIGSLPKDSLDDFVRFCESIETRLGDPRFGDRRVDVRAEWCGDFIELVVQDHGRGYDTTSVLRRPVALDQKSGRGLFLIKDLCETVAVADGGRRLAMTFRR